MENRDGAGRPPVALHRLAIYHLHIILMQSTHHSLVVLV